MSARASSTVKAITRWTCAHKPLSPWMSFSQMEIEQELSLELVQWVLKNSSKRQPAMSLSASPPGCSCKPESSLVTHRLSAELSPSLQQLHVSICIRNKQCEFIPLCVWHFLLPGVSLGLRTSFLRFFERRERTKQVLWGTWEGEAQSELMPRYCFWVADSSHKQWQKLSASGTSSRTPVH